MDGTNGSTLYSGGNVNGITKGGETVWQFLVNMHLLEDPAIAL